MTNNEVKDATASEKLLAVREKVLTKLYKKAEPSADYAELVETADSREWAAYEAHYIDHDEAIEIITEIFEKEGLNQYERSRLKSSILLGVCPSGNKERVNEYRSKHNLEEI